MSMAKEVENSGCNFGLIPQTTSILTKFFGINIKQCVYIYSLSLIRDDDLCLIMCQIQIVLKYQYKLILYIDQSKYDLFN